MVKQERFIYLFAFFLSMGALGDLGDVVLEVYLKGQSIEGEFVTLGEHHLRMWLHNSVIAGKPGDDKELALTYGPRFNAVPVYDGRKIIVPKEIIPAVSREHCRILLEHPPITDIGEAKPTNGSGEVVEKSDADIADFLKKVNVLYQHLSESDAATAIYRKGEGLNVYRRAGECVKFDLRQLQNPTYFLIGFGKSELELEMFQKKLIISTPIIKIWYTGDMDGTPKSS